MTGGDFSMCVFIEQALFDLAKWIEPLRLLVGNGQVCGRERVKWEKVLQQPSDLVTPSKEQSPRKSKRVHSTIIQSVGSGKWWGVVKDMRKEPERSEDNELKIRRDRCYSRILGKGMPSLGTKPRLTSFLGYVYTVPLEMIFLLFTKLIAPLNRGHWSVTQGHFIIEANWPDRRHSLIKTAGELFNG